MKPKKINLNQWEKVDTISDLDNYQSLIITPIKLSDGTQLPDIYFRKGIKKYDEVLDVNTTKWYQDIRISKDGNDDEYGKRVDWWFEQALDNEDYRSLLNTNFNKHGFDIKKSWDMAQNYLKRFNYSSRKTYIHKYVWNWMVRGLHQHMKFKK